MTRLPIPAMAVDDLATLPRSERFRAYDDYDQTTSSWHLARLNRAAGDWCWRLDMHRARRFWNHYRAAVRAARARRTAA